MSARDELVALLGHDDWCDYGEKTPEGCEDSFGCGVWRKADRLLASDWLASLLAAERERIARAIEASYLGADFGRNYDGTESPETALAHAHDEALNHAARIARTPPT